ncbi:glycosyltransferase [Desulfobaculum sp. SPO524]|uniref:glycosyltransferase n=1 Tax=Desulfobaculum sp. SPO524 TaxID=3378071 RepID=UPI0038538BA8
MSDSQRFVLNTRTPDSAGALVCIQSLGRLLNESGRSVTFGDWDNYNQYDVVIFMAHDAEIDKVRSQNPDIKIGIADPKPSDTKSPQQADFLLVSSIEQREVFLKYNPNIFVYYMFPDFSAERVVHTNKGFVTLAYHGNKVHLDCFQYHLTPVLNELGKRHTIRLKAIYNVERLGLWSHGRPDPDLCPVDDLQWYPDCYVNYLSDIDIGIVPQMSPFPVSMHAAKLFPLHYKRWLLSPLDHMSYYKSSANPGRIFVFGMFGIPVVSEAIPSTSSLFHDNINGLQVLTKEGWYDALNRLISSAHMRAELGERLYEQVVSRYSKEQTFQRFLSFLQQPLQQAIPDLQLSIRRNSDALFHDFVNKVKRKFFN